MTCAGPREQRCGRITRTPAIVQTLLVSNLRIMLTDTCYLMQAALILAQMRAKGELVAITDVGFTTASSAFEIDSAAVRTALPLARSSCHSTQRRTNWRRIWQHAACNVPAR